MPTGLYRGPKPTLTITVEGVAGSGKSTVAEIIKQALLAKGISAAIDELRPLTFEATQETRISSLGAGGTHVLVYTQESRRTK